MKGTAAIVPLQCSEGFKVCVKKLLQIHNVRKDSRTGFFLMILKNFNNVLLPNYIKVIILGHTHTHTHSLLTTLMPANNTYDNNIFQDLLC